MYRYVLKRILWLIPVLIGVSLIIFIIMDLAPGDYVDSIATGEMTPEYMDELRHAYGLDQPLILRYLKYMLNFLKGNLGISWSYKISVWEMYITRFPATVKLALAATLIAVVVSVPLGILAALRSGSIYDNACTIFALIGISMPGFWIGLLVILLFSLRLGWFPSGGNEAGIMSLILPACTNSTVMMSSTMRQTRSSMLDTLRSDYLRTARAKGVARSKVIWQHSLKNALIPIITTIGNTLGHALGGAIVIETVFAWPGVGRLLVDAITKRDTELATGCIILITLTLSIVLLIVDLLYAVVDPRIKAQYARGGRKR